MKDKTINMSYKLLVLDLDDTLLRDDYSISETNRKSLIELQQKGVKVILASGRPTPAMMRYVYELKLDIFESFILAYNGAEILNCKNNTSIFTQALSKEEIHMLYDWSKKLDTTLITYHDDSIITDTITPYVEIESKLTGMPIRLVDNFKEKVQKEAIKCLMLDEPDKLEKIEKLLQVEIPSKSIARSKPFFLEITEKGIDKAASLDKLAQQLNIRSNEIVAVGNAGNDLSMIQYAGLGIWVDNVTPSLRELADDIVASNMNDGVTEVVYKYFLKN